MGRHGLRLKGADLASFHQNFVTSCHLKKDSSYEDIEMDLDNFRIHFKELFGGKLVRTINRTKSKLDNASIKHDFEGTLRERSTMKKLVEGVDEDRKEKEEPGDSGDAGDCVDL